MIGIVYAQRWNGKWCCDKLGSLPNPIYAWKCNESFWLLPHVAQAMCWAEPAAGPRGMAVPQGWDKVEG